MCRIILCIISVFLFFASTSKLLSQNLNKSSLSVEAAIQKAVANNPTLKVLRQEIEARKAAKVQSGLMPNPVLAVDAENILGSGDYSGFNGSEITALISQDILLAGKISKQEKIAEMDITLAEWDYEEERISTITNIRKLFVKTLSKQNLIEKNEELQNLSKKLIVNLEGRVKAGKISPAEVSRAKIIMNGILIELGNLKNSYRVSINELKASIFDPSSADFTLEGSFDNNLELPQYDSLLVQLEQNPKLNRFSSEYEKQKAVLSFAESQATPNLTISAGYKRLNEVGANTFVIGAEIPIPLFNRNQGAIQEEEIRFGQKKNDYESVKYNLVIKLNLLYNNLLTLNNIATQLRTESIPETESAYKIIAEGNLLGRFTILDLLDTQRTLVELQNQYLSVMSEIQLAKIEIEGLIAKEIN